MTISDVQFQQAISNCDALNKKFVNEVRTRLKVKIEVLAHFILREFGILHQKRLSDVLEHDELRNSLARKIQAIAQTHAAIAAGRFEELIQSLCSNTSDFVGINYEDIEKRHRKMVRYFPLPHEQLQEALCRGKKTPFSSEEIAAFAKEEDVMVENIFGQLDSVAQDDQKAPEDLWMKLEEFVFSKAGLVTEGNFHSWCTLILEWGLYNVEAEPKTKAFFGQMQGIKLLSPRVVPIEDAQIPLNLSFRQYLAWRSVASVERHLHVKFSQKYRETLCKLFVAEDRARRQAVYLTACKQFSAFISVPSDTHGEDYLEQMLFFAKLRTRVNLSGGEEALLFEWISETAILPKNLLDVDYTEVSASEMIAAAQKLSETARISLPNRCYCFASLCRMKNRNLFLQFLEQAVEAGLPVMNAGFISLFFDAKCDGLDYQMVLGNFRAVHEMIKHYQVPEAPDRFWRDLCRVQFSIEDRAKAFTEHLREEVNYPLDFFELLFRYLEGRIINDHFAALIQFSNEIDSVKSVEVLAHVNNPVVFPISQERSLAIKRAITYLREEYRLQLWEAGVLFFELVNLEPDIVFQEIRFIWAIEKFSSSRMQPLQVYNWMMFHPKVEDADRVLKSLFRLRSDLLSRHLEMFALPTDFLVEFHNTFSSFYLLEQEGAQWVKVMPTDFHKHMAPVGIQVMFSMVPSTVQPISDFVSAAAIKDTPVLCGEEDRTVLHTETLCLFCADTRAIWRGWDIPQDGEQFPVFNAHFMRMDTFEVSILSFPVKIAWKHFLEDPLLIDFLHQAVYLLGEENHEHGVPLEVGTEMERHLHLFPRFTDKWEQFQPAQLEKQAVGAAFFEFVKQVKIAFRKAMLHLAVGMEPFIGELLSPSPMSAIYKTDRGFSLLPPRSLVPSSHKSRFSVGSECDEIVQSWAKHIGEGQKIEKSAQIADQQTVKLSFDPLPIEEREDPICLNQVILSIGDTRHKIRYQKLVAHDRFAEILKLHILLLLNKVYRNA